MERAPKGGGRALQRAPAANLPNHQTLRARAAGGGGIIIKSTHPAGVRATSSSLEPCGVITIVMGVPHILSRIHGVPCRASHWARGTRPCAALTCGRTSCMGVTTGRGPCTISKPSRPRSWRGGNARSENPASCKVTVGQEAPRSRKFTAAPKIAQARSHWSGEEGKPYSMGRGSAIAHKRSAFANLAQVMDAAGALNAPPPPPSCGVAGKAGGARS